MRFSRVLAAAALLLAAGAVRAADEAPQVSIAVAVQPPQPAANDTIRVSYTFSGKDADGSLRVPPSIPLKGLTLVGGPSTSTQVQMINMSFSRSVSVSYFVRPNAQGPAEVGEATFELGGKPVKAKGASLDIGPPRAGPPAGEGGEEEDPFDRFFARPRRAVPDQPLGLQRRGEAATVEYVVTPDKTTAFVGEEITLTYELVTQVDVDALEPVDPPKFPGCWAEDLERPEHPTATRGVYEGKPVLRFLLQKKVVSGLAPGPVTLPAAKVRLGVRGGGDPFADPFGFTRRQVLERSTKPLTLKFLPIPGVAGDFKGPIGKFDITAKLDPPQVAAGAATTLKVRISGTGNLRTATEPPAVKVEGARLYPPTRAAEPAKAQGRSGQTVEWDYVLVPNAPGALTVPPIALAVFDPAAKRVVTRATAPLTLAVEGTAAAAAPAPPGTAGNAVTEEPALAAAPEKRGVSSRPTPTPSGPAAVDLKTGTVTLPLWLLAAVPGALLILGAGAVVARRRTKTRESLLSVLAPEADETKERAAARIERALRELLAAKGIPESVPAAQVAEAMRAAGQPAARVAETKDLLEDLEFLRFAPQLGDYADRIRAAREKAARLLPKLR